VKIDLRSKRTVLLGLFAISVLLFAGGVLAFFLSRNQTICPSGQQPVSYSSELLAPTTYLCPGGTVVTK
jgi:hypothetical protein